MNHLEPKTNLISGDFWDKVTKYFETVDYNLQDNATKYALDVYFNRRITSKMVKYATARHLLFLYRQIHENDFPLFYDPTLLEYIIRFSQKLNISSSKERFLFFDFRQFMSGFTFGWSYKNEPLKFLTREVFDVEARKQGKSSFWSMIILAVSLGLMFKSEADIVICGPVKESSNILFNIAARYISSSPLIRKKFKKNNSRSILSNKNNSVNALPFEENVLEGKDPLFVVLTEYHLHPSDTMYQSALRSYSGFKQNMLLIFDTTKGGQINSVCFEREKSYKKFLEQQIANPYEIHTNANIFLWCAELDDDDFENWKDDKLWVKANPILDVPKLGERHLTALREEFNKIDNIASEVSFLNKRLGVWTGNDSTHFNYADIAKSNNESRKLIQKHIDNDFEGLNSIMGVDLSSNIDTTAITLLFQIPLDGSPHKNIENQIWVFKSYVFIPENIAALKEKIDKVPYRDWQRKGYVETTPGDTLDYNHIKQKINFLKSKYNSKIIAYDEWFFSQIKYDLINNYYLSERTFQPIKQGVQLSGAFNLFERKLKHGQIHFLENEATMNHISNAVIKTTSNSNILVQKAATNERIDNFMAVLNTVSVVHKVSPISSNQNLFVVPTKK